MNNQVYDWIVIGGGISGISVSEILSRGRKKVLLIEKNENRNYLYNINKHSNRMWSIVLGKFSLAFSMAPEFYRQIYKENPPKVISEASIQSNNNLVSKTSWQEIIDNKGGKYGDD